MGSSGDDGTREQPICIAVIICNEIIEDKRTNNKTLVSLFNGIGVAQLPTVHPRMFVMASLTNASGKHNISFRVKGPSDQEVARFEGEAFFTDPLAVVDIVVDVQGLKLPEYGTYFVDIFSGSHPLGHRRFNVHKLQTQSRPGE